MTKNGRRPGYAFVLAGIIGIAALAVVFSGKIAAVTAGVGLLLLAALRAAMRGPVAIAARSARFDTVLLALLGVGTLVLALTADNI